MAGPIPTATELSELTGIPLADDLAREQFLLEMASGMIRAFCHQELWR